VILEQLLLGIMVVAVTLLLLPFLLVMAGGALIFWVVFPGTYGLAILLLVLVIGLLLVDRQTRHGAP